MIKKIITVLIVITTLLAFCGCNDNSNNNQSKKEDNNPGEIVETTFDDKLTPSTYEEEKTSYNVIYFDSKNGNDSNDGKTESNAKKSLTELNSVVGSVRNNNPTKILIKAGSVYEGTLKALSFSASEEYPLIISVYGKTESDKYALFKGESNCVEINRGNIRISGIECVSINGNRGFYVYSQEAGAIKNIVISDNYIHDINFDFENGLPIAMQGKGKLPGDSDVNDSLIDRPAVCSTSNYVYLNSGIYFTTDTDSNTGASWFENVWIENNIITRVSRDGIFINSNWAKRPGLDWGNNKYVSDDNGWYPHKNINILNNDISYTGGDAICTIAVDGGFVQGNTSYHAGYLMRSGMYSAGIWPHSCKNMVFQYNEAAYTHLFGGGDGQGFDIDMGCSNIIFQYNYAHDNEGGGILLCSCWTKIAILNEKGKPVLDEDDLPIVEYRYPYWGNNYIRNNAFVDNGRNVFQIQGGIKDLYIDNNTIILAGETSKEGIVNAEVWGDPTIHGENWSFSNNIFYLRNTRKVVFSLEYCPNAKLSNNIFYNFDESLFEYLQDTTAGYKFELRNNKDYTYTLNNEAALDGISNVSKFVIKDDRCFKEGIALKKMSKYDILGNEATKTYIGAFSKQ